MNKKLLISSFIITNFVFALLFYIVNSSLNRDQKGYISQLKTINAQQISGEENYIVSIISYGCPDHTSFMPELKDNINLIKSKGYNLYIVNDSEYSQEAEDNIRILAEEYQLSESIYFIDPKEYPKNGGFFYPKTRYYDFVTDLSTKTKNLRMGYGYYMIFKNGELIDDDYELKAEML